MENLDIVRDLKKTKIVSTLGPKSEEPEMMREMFKNGTDIIRFNCSHGMRRDKLKLMKRLRKLQLRIKNLHFGMGIDTKGPEIRTQCINGPIKVKKDSVHVFCNLLNCNSHTHVHFNFQNTAMLKKGANFFVDDGKLMLTVIKATPTGCMAKASNEHTIESNKSVNIPDYPLGIPFIDQKDREDIDFGTKNRINFIFASFVSCKKDIDEIRIRFNIKSFKPLVIAKIESVHALKNFKEILAAADGIMIARGDLFAEVGYSKMFSVQKLLTSKTKKAKKPIIVATQMIENMTKKYTPTRPEITDIGNAVLDENDCIMTSCETAVGDHPHLVVKTMKTICLDAEFVCKKGKRIVTNLDIKKIKRYARCKTNKKKEVKVDALILVARRYSTVLKHYREDLPIPIFVIARSRFELQKCTILQNVFPILKSKKIIDNKDANMDEVCKEAKELIETLYRNKTIKTALIYSKVHRKQKIIEYEPVREEKQISVTGITNMIEDVKM